MAQNLNQNGSFVQRRKMYVQFAFHNMQSKIPIDWQEQQIATQEKRRIVERQQQEQEHIRKMYNQRIERKLQQKYSAGNDTFRAIPNQITLQKERDALEKEIQTFNHSKVYSNSGTKNNPEYAEPGERRNYPPSQQMNNSPLHHEKPPYKGQQNYQPQRNHEYLQQYNPPSSHQYPHNPYPPNSPPQSRIYSNNIHDVKRSESTSDRYQTNQPPNIYNYDLMKEYRKYAQKLPGYSYSNDTIRNSMPDKLQGYLRQKTKADRKRAINASLSLAQREKGF